MASGRFVALLPTHEQAWMFAVGRELLPNAPVAVAAAEAFGRVESKLAFARSLDEVRLPQPAWQPVEHEDDLDALGFPVWVKAAFSTAGRGVRRAQDHAQALEAWRKLSTQCGSALCRGRVPSSFRTRSLSAGLSLLLLWRDGMVVRDVPGMLRQEPTPAACCLRPVPRQATCAQQPGSGVIRIRTLPDWSSVGAQS